MGGRSVYLYQAKSAIISFWLFFFGGGGRWSGPKIKVAQNVPKHILVLKIFESDEMLNFFVTVYKRTDGRTDTIVTRHVPPPLRQRAEN